MNGAASRPFSSAKRSLYLGVSAKANVTVSQSQIQSQRDASNESLLLIDNLITESDSLGGIFPNPRAPQPIRRHMKSIASSFMVGGRFAATSQTAISWRAARRPVG